MKRRHFSQHQTFKWMKCSSVDVLLTRCGRSMVLPPSSFTTGRWQHYNNELHTHHRSSSNSIELSGHYWISIRMKYFDGMIHKLSNISRYWNMLELWYIQTGWRARAPECGPAPAPAPASGPLCAPPLRPRHHLQRQPRGWIDRDTLITSSRY